MFLKYYINKLYNKVKNYLNFRLCCYSDFILNIVGLAAFNTFSGNYFFKRKRNFIFSEKSKCKSDFILVINRAQ